MEVNLITDRKAPGPYDWRDFNRVGGAVQDIADRLLMAGYIVPDVIPKTDWGRKDTWKPAEMAKYLQDVRDVSSVIFPTPAKIPETMRFFSFHGANEIERALFVVDAALTGMEKTKKYAGEIFAGGGVI